LDQEWFNLFKDISFDDFAYEIMMKTFATPNLEKIKPKLETLFENERSFTGSSFEHEVILKLMTSTIFEFGFENELKI